MRDTLFDGLILPDPLLSMRVATVWANGSLAGKTPMWATGIDAKRAIVRYTRGVRAPCAYRLCVQFARHRWS